MLYPDNRVFYCKYCGKKFDFAAGYNSPRLIEHLFTVHHDVVMQRYGDLYLADLVKKCYKHEGGAHDRRTVRVPAGY